jgi:hypothetical protein
MSAKQSASTKGSNKAQIEKYVTFRNGIPKINTSGYKYLERI